MDIRDLTVEVRDRNLQRVGQITGEFLSGEFKPAWCGVGTWKVNLPAGHPMVPHLQAKGSGIIVTGPVGTSPTNNVNGATVYGPMFSGPTTTPLAKRTQKTPQGTFTFSGVTDEVILQGALAYPSPEVADPNAQTRANDTRTATAEYLLRSYVAYNITYDQGQPGRIRGLRRFLDVGGSNQSRGPLLTKSPRFQNLLELLREIVANAPALGFRVVQRDNLLHFEVVSAGDRRGVVRFDVENGSLSSEEVAKVPPSVTYPIVGGQGEGTARQVVVRTDAEAAQEESDWGLVYEVFLDRRDVATTAELQQAGDEALFEGRGGISAKVTPASRQGMAFGRDWNLGDQVTAVVGGVETAVRVTEAVILADASGLAVGAALGDVSGFTVQASEAKKAVSLDDRIARLERSEAAGLAPRLRPEGSQVTDWNTATDSGFYWATSSAANSPGNFSVVGIVEGRESGTAVVQTVHRSASTAPGEMVRSWRRRGSMDTGVWTDWVEVLPTWDQVTGKPSTFTPSSHSHPWSEVTGKPSTFPPSSHSHAWSEVTGKPSTFTPSSHSHAWADITDPKAHTLTPQPVAAEPPAWYPQGMSVASVGGEEWPASIGTVFTARHSAYRQFQLFTDRGSPARMWMRTATGDDGWTPFQEVMTSSRAATQSEVNAGTVADRFVTPATLRNATHQPFRIASGAVSTPASGYVTVTLPSGFTQPPNVVGSGGDQSSVAVSRIVNRTATSFQIGTWALGGAQIAGSNVAWQAVQMTATSANG